MPHFFQELRSCPSRIFQKWRHTLLLLSMELVGFALLSFLSFLCCPFSETAIENLMFINYINLKYVFP